MNLILGWILCGAVIAAFEIHHTRHCAYCGPRIARRSYVRWYAHLALFVLAGPLAVLALIDVAAHRSYW